MSRQMLIAFNNLTKAYTTNMPGFACLRSVNDDTMLAVGLYPNAIAFTGEEEPQAGRLRC